ncbi:MAG: NAD(P)H-dependent glycerol-3-phosphate dehydrogenase [Candidatus Methylacidiphilales bacterium]|nr:NAD(P)H-dependent glycerol-3-phosphate dehydrogenase [Candidatus Methylacidiphilales bacterium]
MRVTIIGKGAWGSAFGKLLERNGHEVGFLEREHTSWPPAGPGDLVVLALPCQSLRARLGSLQHPGVPVISLIKGLEIATRLRVSQIVEQVWPGSPLASVSGPSFASEVQTGAPTAAVVASLDPALAARVQEMAHQTTFRLYRSNDLVGVELGGALKNVYALAGGMCEGLGIGENGLAGLMTRSLAEMVRVVGVSGGRMETVFGLGGMGDLILTAYSGQSRNHQVGVALGRGRELGEILDHLGGTAEGVPTSKALYEIVTEHRIKAPIATEIYQVLYGGKRVAEGMRSLLTRSVDEE